MSSSMIMVQNREAQSNRVLEGYSCDLGLPKFDFYSPARERNHSEMTHAEAESIQCSRILVPKTITGMVFRTRVLKGWARAPS